MPFTPAHAAAVLPLLRTPLPASALVIGSVAPDLPYYTPAGIGLQTHSALALVTTDLVIGAAAWALWHAVLAPAAIAAAPRRLQTRLAGSAPTGLRRRVATPRMVLLVIVALVVGAATHVGWDELSHPGRWGTEHLVVLREPVGGLEGYRWVQYGSGLLGCVVLGVWLLRWWRRAPLMIGAPVRAGRSRVAWVWLGLLAVAMTAGVVAAALAPDLRAAAFAGATVGGGSALAVATVGALLWRRALPGGGPGAGRVGALPARGRRPGCSQGGGGGGRHRSSGARGGS